MGSGRSELLLSLFGAGPKNTQGEVSLLGRKYRPRSPADAAKAGMVLVTEDRKSLGLMLEHAVLDNAALTPLGLGLFSWLGMVLKRKRLENVSNMLNQLKLKSPSLITFVQNLSGGNQQKVVLSKWLLTKPKILFLDEPTRGIDVGARSEFYTLIRELASQGMAVLVVSSELPEVMGISDRLMVMNEGKIVYETDDFDIKPETLMSYATGAAC
jgi:D-xylose transport system ATP-binding protein